MILIRTHDKKSHKFQVNDGYDKIGGIGDTTTPIKVQLPVLSTMFEFAVENAAGIF